jgi:hypothetical protein
VALQWAMQITLHKIGWCWEGDGAERKWRNDKWRSSSHQKQLSFRWRIDVRKQKCVLEYILDRKGRMPFCFVFFF